MGVTFTALLAGTQLTLKEQIQENQSKALNEAIAEVVPELASTEELEIDGRRVFKCLGADGSLVGWAVQSSGGGFVDKITLVVGLNSAADAITGLKVIEQVETPGLGNKIAEAWWDDQYDGMDASRKITVIKGEAKPGENQIEAITGATWSSRFVTDIVNAVMVELRPKLEAHRQAPSDAGTGSGE